MKIAIVTTTINVPTLFADYAADAVKYGHKDAEFIVIGDRKTPAGAEEFCRKAAQESGLPVRWYGVPEQEKFLKDFPELVAHLPWNSVQRRNIGHLIAWLEGFEAIVAIDDDNFREDPDYVGLHAAALQAKETEMVSAADGWFNCCTLLKEAQGRAFFPRGYPVSMRRGKHGALTYSKTKARIVVNAGLWLGEPDIDAVTRLAAPPDVVACMRKETLALAPGTWCPFNSQNTAVHRDALPAWFLSPHIGRFDDIWSSYIIIACAEKLGHAVAFGSPLVRQDRNAHNLWHDLDLERFGMRTTEGFCGALRGAKVTGKDYASCTAELMNALETWYTQDKALTAEDRKALEALVQGYRMWLTLFERLKSAKA
jgi:hypothetical protein